MGLSDRNLLNQARRAVSFLNERALRREADQIAPFLDSRFYLETYPDVAASGQSAAYHYAKHGWREGRDPTQSFSTLGYLAANPAVAMAGQNPFLHFTSQQAAEAPDKSRDSRKVVDLIKAHVNSGFYEQTYPEFADQDLSAAQHYDSIGWRKGYDPAPDFSTSYYLLTNPDVRDSGLNPFWHYLITGRDEGRLPSHPGGWRHQVLSRQKTFDEVCDGWIMADTPSLVLSSAQIIDALTSHRKASQLIISIGHDDYRKSPGGVQLCIELEEKNAHRYDADYLNLHPVQPLPKFADPEDDPILVLVLNGDTLGSAPCSEVTKAFAGTQALGHAAKVVIHHLAGHSPEHLVDLVKATRSRSCAFWLHDYFSLCTSFALQRNNVAPCSAPGPDSNACQICHFGQSRRSQLARLGHFWGELDVHVISPSQAAEKFWKSRTDLAPASLKVQPHLRLQQKRKTPQMLVEGPVRIAFVGTRSAHKGWPVFEELFKRLSSDSEYSFFSFGVTEPTQKDIQHVATHIRASDPGVIVRAIAENEIDIVLHWAAWAETFSFSTFEAMAGGAFVVTNAGSGNVAAAVKKHRRGLVLSEDSALYELAGTGGLKELARLARAKRSKTHLETCFGDFSFAALDMPVAS